MEHGVIGMKGSDDMTFADPRRGESGRAAGPGRATPSRPRGGHGYVRIPLPAPGERYGWNFTRGDRFAFDFDPDAGDCHRSGDRLLFRINGGEISLLGPCDSRSLNSISVRLPNGRVLPLDSLVSDDETIDRIARSLGGSAEE